jgi:hypothetical protein
LERIGHSQPFVRHAFAANGQGGRSPIISSNIAAELAANVWTPKAYKTNPFKPRTLPRAKMTVR